MDALQKEFGSSVALLTFHVDYWDHLGWKDPFSSPEFTERQKMYGQAFNQSSIYTPEIVIQGKAGFVGSDLRAARRVIQEELRQQRSSVDVRLKPSGKATEVGLKLAADVAGAAKTAEIILFENAPAVAVLRGENAGVTMSGRYAVRSVQRIPLSAGQGRTTVTVPSQGGGVSLIRGESGAILATSLL